MPAPRERRAGRRRLREGARRWARRLFPPEVALPPDLRRALALVYPALDLDAVRFHLGLPHVFLWVYTEGVTLPAGLLGWPCRSRVYIDPPCWQPETVEGTGLVLHEAFHALQMQETGRGIGLAHPFLVLYLASAAANGFRYRGHPLEVAAYELAGDDGGRFERSAAERGSGDGLEGSERERICAEIAVPSSGLRFWRCLRESAPAAPLLPFWLVGWALAVIVLALTEAIFFAVSGLFVALLGGLGLLAGSAMGGGGLAESERGSD